MITIHRMPQKSPEWFEAKKGLLSASFAKTIGANGSGLKSYCKDLANQICEGVDDDSFYNSDMERGDYIEPIAIQNYLFEFGEKGEDVGGITNRKYPNVWVSPDYLIGDDGGLEVKARNRKKHFNLIMGDEKEIPFEQIQMCLLVSERKWWDFISYNESFKKHPMFIKRIYPDAAYFKKLMVGFKIGDLLIPKYVNSYKEYKHLR